MTLKQRKYKDIKKFTKIINAEVNSIWMVAHINNLDIIQSNILKTFCDSNNVKHIFLKLNLLRKLTKNKLFINLFAGPTKLFFFKDVDSFLYFTKNLPLERKIVPLSIYYNNQFFSYLTFLNRLNTVFTAGNSNLIKQNLILNLNKKSINLLQTLTAFRNNFILFLTLMNKNLNKK